MTRRRVAPALLTLVGALLVVDLAMAQVLARSQFSNGVTPTSGGGFVLRGALGQPFTGGIGGPANKACAGFWCVPGFGVVGVEPPRDGDGKEALVFALGPMTPNPTRGTARIDLVLPSAGHVRLDAFDVTGRRVGESFERALDAGRYRLAWESAGAGAGVFFVRVSVDGVVRGERRVVVSP